MYQNYLYPQQNPYYDRMNFLVGTQMSLPNQSTQVGKIVDSIDVVKATDIPMDGNIYYFPKADGTEVFGKQWLSNGQTRILRFKAFEDVEPNNSTINADKAILDLSDNVTRAFMERFDELESKLDGIIGKKQASKPKKESESV